LPRLGAVERLLADLRRRPAVTVNKRRRPMTPSSNIITGIEQNAGGLLFAIQQLFHNIAFYFCESWRCDWSDHG
jgi:hypothetical protein